jgi:hypothetical protein
MSFHAMKIKLQCNFIYLIYKLFSALYALLALGKILEVLLTDKPERSLFSSSIFCNILACDLLDFTLKHYL